MDLMNDISSENVAISLLPKSLKDSISSSMTESQIKVFDYTTNIIIVLVILYYLTVVFHSFFHTKDNKNNKDNKDFKDYIHVVGNRKLFNKIAQISMSSSFVVILALVVFNVYSHDILSKWFKLSKE
jgi:Ca2+/H+ antiporter